LPEIVASWPPLSASYAAQLWRGYGNLRKPHKPWPGAERDVLIQVNMCVTGEKPARPSNRCAVHGQSTPLRPTNTNEMEIDNRNTP
jgi:hypothetical protein